MLLQYTQVNPEYRGRFFFQRWYQWVGSYWLGSWSYEVSPLPCLISFHISHQNMISEEMNFPGIVACEYLEE